MATQTFEQLIAGANKIKENELPESNTHDLIGEQLLQMTNKMREISLVEASEAAEEAKRAAEEAKEMADIASQSGELAQYAKEQGDYAKSAGDKVTNEVLFKTAQSLTEEEQAQVKQNIGINIPISGLELLDWEDGRNGTVANDASDTGKLISPNIPKGAYIICLISVKDDNMTLFVPSITSNNGLPYYYLNNTENQYMVTIKGVSSDVNSDFMYIEFTLDNSSDSPITLRCNNLYYETKSKNDLFKGQFNTPEELDMILGKKGAYAYVGNPRHLYDWDNGWVDRGVFVTDVDTVLNDTSEKAVANKTVAAKFSELEEKIGEGVGGALGGYKTVDSIDNLPSIGEENLGYIIGTKLYIYVGTGGDTLDGKYKDVGEFRGPEGATPEIGENGNWFINGVDTGKPAKGTDGKDGQPGKDGADGVSLGEIALVQETGTGTGSENKVMSQKAVSEKFSELDKTSIYRIYQKTITASNQMINLEIPVLLGAKFSAIMKSDNINNISEFKSYIVDSDTIGSVNYRNLSIEKSEDEQYYIIEFEYEQDDLINNRKYFRLYFNSIIDTVDISVSLQVIQPGVVTEDEFVTSVANILPEQVQAIPLESYPFFEKNENNKNLFNKDSITEGGYFSQDGITFTVNSDYNTTDYIPVESGQSYRRINMSKNGYIYIYDNEQQPILYNGKYYLQDGAGENFTVPTETETPISFVRIVFDSTDDINTIMIGLSTEDFSEYIPYIPSIIKEEYLPKSENIKNTTEVLPSNIYGKSDVGNLVYEEIGEADYNQIILYGQSLSMGWEAPEVITTEAVDGNYMVGTLPLIYSPNMEPSDFNPLVAVKWSAGGEQPIVGCTNAFSRLYRRFVNRNQLFIGSNAGEGGRSIELLSKDCTNGENFYTTRFLKLLDSTKSIADGKDKTVNCSAILYMQGEYNYTKLTGAGLTPGTDATNDKDTYKALLLKLKNDMQADIMEKYGQKNKPLFFIYEVAGTYINNKEMTINMAQIEFAQENDDVCLLSPTYFTPDYNGGHLSTNGYRWYGEMIAKSLYSVFIKGENYKPVFPMNYRVDEKKLTIDFYVPVPPLVFDTWTKETIANMGFKVFNDGSEVTINNIEIVGNSVLITCASNLSGTVEVTYAGQGRSGSGNLRDSDAFHSYYTYFDDRETSPSKRENYTPKDKEGNFIYDKPYPMYNWCANFYHKMTTEVVE